MNRIFTRTALIFLATGACAWLVAGGNSIGMAVTNGDFLLDHARVNGSTTVFSGSSIETSAVASELQLKDGAKVRLGSNGRAIVYERKLVLEQGTGQLESAAGYEVEARSLHIAPVTSDAVARVGLQGSRNVEVLAVRGDVKVTNAKGLLIAKIEPGKSLNFAPQLAGASTATQASGCLLVKSGKLILVDRTTNVILEIQGSGLEGQVGNRVDVTAKAANTTTTVADASQVVQATGVTLVAKGGCTGIAKKVGAQTSLGAATAGAGVGGAAGAGGAAAGVGSGAAGTAGIAVGTVAVIGGVAAAATVGGLAAAGNLPGQGSTPSASR